MTNKKREEVFDQPMTFMQATIDLIEKDGRTDLELYRATGIPHHWIANLRKGNCLNPSVNRVQYLFEYLSGRKLFA